MALEEPFTFSSRRRRPLPSEEQALSAFDMLSGAGSAALTGLGYLGGSIEKPARAIRAGLQTLKTGDAKHLRDMLAFIPLSDTLRITDPKERVSGKQLLGMSEDTGFFTPETAAGLATEIALDPLTYLSLGSSAVSKLGAVARRAGVLPKTGAARAAGLASHTDEALKLARQTLQEAGTLPANPVAAGMASAGKAQQLAGQSLGGNIKFMGKTPYIGKALEKTAGVLGNNPLTRRAAQLFSRPVTGRSTSEGQGYARSASEAQKMLEAEFSGEVLDVINKVPEPIRRAMVDESNPKRAANLARNFRSILEGVPGARAGATFGPAKKAWDVVRQRMIQRGRAIGIPEQELDDLIDYVPRQANPAIVAKGKLDLTGGMNVGIKPEARWNPSKGITGGTRALNDFLKKPLMASADDTAGHVFKDLYGMDPTDFGTLRAEKEAIDTAKAAATDLLKTPADRAAALRQYEAIAPRWDAAKAGRFGKYEEAMSNAQQLAKWKHDVTGQLKVDFFGNNPLKDIGNAQRFARGDKLYGALKSAAVPIAQAGEDAVPITQALAAHGLTYTDNAGTHIPKARMAAALGVAEDQLKNFAIPKRIFDDIHGLGSKLTDPGKWREIVGLWDNVTNLIKTGQTVVWPQHHVRNQMTAFFQHWMHGVKDPLGAGPGAYLKPWKDARAWSQGKTIEGLSQAPAFRGMTDEQATKALMDEVIKWDIPGTRSKLSRVESAGIGGNPAMNAQLREIIPGLERESWQEIGKEFKNAPRSDWKTWLKTSGGTYKGKRLTEEVNPLYKLGRKTAGKLDEQNRVAAFIARVKQGYSFDEAAREVDKIHFNFQGTAMADPWMRRAVPYWLWTRESVARNVQALMNKPGGKLAQTVRVAREARGDKPGFLPEGLGAGVAIPLGEEKDGRRQFLSSFGAPIEDLGELAHGGVRGALGQLNPLLKYPLEQASGMQFYSGRELKDLYSRLNLPRDYQPLENLAMQSPIGRAVNVGSNIRNVLSGDKSPLHLLNIGTGVRVSDVDVEKSRYSAQRKRLAELASRYPNIRSFTSLAVPERLRGQASAEEMALAALFSDLARMEKRRTGGTVR
jgi:hypothetical protein